MPTTNTLRPFKEESINFDNTQNLYIEGDNLEVLKCLRTTYLNKIKMIYIDPPYNTGNDFIYNDDFSKNSEEYLIDSKQMDADKNKLVYNPNTNGRFHTDWLNMMYPRLKLARNLLTDDGIILISIDDNELENIKKIANEIFGEKNFRNTILTRRRVKSLNSQFAQNGLKSLNVGFEYILLYSKSDNFLFSATYKCKEKISQKGRWDVFWSNADRPTMRYELLGFTPQSGQWRNSKEKALIAVSNYQEYLANYSDQMTLEEYSSQTGITSFIRRIENGIGKNGGVQHWIPPSEKSLRDTNWLDIEVSQIGKEIKIPFDNPKNKNLIIELIRAANLTNDDIILDFFSGSATTAHAVMQLNAEERSNRKFIMIQVPEKTKEDSDAFKAGFKTICDIGKERIKLAGQKIKEEFKDNAKGLDIGFRVLKLDTSNMYNVFYNAKDITQELLNIRNFKEDRSDQDLLFQVMLEHGIELSAHIEEIFINDKRIFKVNNNYLLACFDDSLNNNTIEEIAKMKPYYFVMLNNSVRSDDILDNFEQIFKQYSKNTECEVI